MNIIISNITKLFGKQKVLDNISFSVGEGELLGVLGPNGAGKSTLMKIITGSLPADSGQVLIDDEKITPDNFVFRGKIGYLPENNPLYSDLYVKEYLEIVAGLYKLTAINERIREIIQLTGLENEQHKKIGSLSKGYRQRIGIAQALIHDPSVLIMDEPTTGLDPNQLEEVRNLIRNISKKKTVILSSHIMQEVEAICNRIVIINRGKIIADGSIDDIKNGNLNHNQIVIAGFDRDIDTQKLIGIEGVKGISYDGKNYEIEADGNFDIRHGIFHFAKENGLTLLTLAEKKQNLENIFQQLTSDNKPNI